MARSESARCGTSAVHRIPYSLYRRHSDLIPTQVKSPNQKIRWHKDCRPFCLKRSVRALRTLKRRSQSLHLAERSLSKRPKRKQGTSRIKNPLLNPWIKAVEVCLSRSLRETLEVGLRTSSFIHSPPSGVESSSQETWCWLKFTFRYLSRIRSQSDYSENGRMGKM